MKPEKYRIRLRRGLFSHDWKKVSGFILNRFFAFHRYSGSFVLDHLPTGQACGFFRTLKALRRAASYLVRYSDKKGLASTTAKGVMKAIPRNVRAYVKRQRGY
jgi:predicted NAD/FAD-binding protein